MRAALRPGATLPDRVTPETGFYELQDAFNSKGFSDTVSGALGLPFSVDVARCETVQDVMDELVAALVSTPQAPVVTNFFGSYWTEPEHSIAFKEDLAAELLRTGPRSVLDVGCGSNYFRHRVPNVVGVDVASDAADVKCDILEFDAQGEKFDAILALGSINFGSRRVILDTLRCAKSLLADDGLIYMRVNPGIPWPAEPRLIIYPWSEEKVHDHAKRVGLKPVGQIGFHDGTNGRRMSFRYAHESELNR